MRPPRGETRIQVFLFAYTIIVVALYAIVTTNFPALGKVLAAW